MAARKKKTSRANENAGDALYPLDFVYERSGVVLPKVSHIRTASIPDPYRKLLDHEDDMTLTLERHYGGEVVLRPLATFEHGGSYFRRVLLVQAYSGRPVEMGAIRMKLSSFPQAIRRKILANHIPLGRILHDGNIDHKSRPTTFLKIQPNAEMMGVFWMREPRTLYGRRTEIFHGPKKIGDIVEVLPPA